MELGAGDAGFWVYRGEGAANIVLAYRGPDSALEGKVLRLRKGASHAPQAKDDRLKSTPYLSEHEQVLWAEWPDIAAATSVAAVGHAYARQVICPLLGSQHVDPGILVHVSREFLEAVHTSTYDYRPPWRREEGSLHFAGGMALLLSDHSEFPGLPMPVHLHPVISVEIKPKCGFLPEAGLLGEKSSEKGSNSRFALHQHLKHLHGKVATKSIYSPLDLFSGARDRMVNAIQALFETPQNNLAVFVNGVKLYGNGVETCIGEDRFSRLEKSLELHRRGEGENLVQSLQGLVADVLYRSDVLQKLLSAQMLDVLDIEGCIHVYYTFLGLTCEVCKEYKRQHGTIPQVPDAAKLHSLAWEECRAIVRNYLISATAKDCGVMLTFQALPDDDDESEHPYIFECSSSRQKYRYKVFFLDLDLKPLRKMPRYYELDQQIVQTLQETVLHGVTDDE